MRFLGVDFGQRRIGLALTDATATLARPWKMVQAAGSPRASAAVVAAAIAALRASNELDAADLDGIVVGVPKRLGGEDTQQTEPAREFARALEAATGLTVHLQDERLTSYEADRRLAEQEPDWRRRKKKLDAAAAAIILQDYLDQRARTWPAGRFGQPGPGW
jgi:putative Holliday junction resolvase